MIEIMQSIENFVLFEDIEKITSATLVYKATSAYDLLPFENLQHEIRNGIDSALLKLENTKNKESRINSIYKAFYNVCFSWLIK